MVKSRQNCADFRTPEFPFANALHFGEDNCWNDERYLALLGFFQDSRRLDPETVILSRKPYERMGVDYVNVRCSHRVKV